jgi:hypothetical protein
MEDAHDFPVEEEREKPPNWARTPDHKESSRDLKEITYNQKGFIRALMERHEMQPEDRTRLSRRLDSNQLDRGQASKTIEWLQRQPLKGPTQQSQNGPMGGNPELVALCKEHGIRAGRYAVENEDNVLRFYTVDIPTQGRWSGWVFVKVWASDEKHPIKGFDTRLAILKKIAAAGAKAAMERFGREIGACGICGRTLTDPTSIEIGIGPICRDKSEWY